MRLFKVQETKFIGHNTVLLTLTPKRKRDAITFYPGQYAAIGFKRYGRPSPMRCFSIVSSPRNPEVVQFAMRVQGNFTKSVSELKRGNTVFLHGPFGEFAIDERYDKNIILLAGGIGITPFVSMARYAAEINLQIPLTLLYSCSNPRDIPFLEELLELEQRNPLFHVAFFITQGSVDELRNIRRLRGRIDARRLEQLTGGQFNRFTYFICGPKQFTKSLKDLLLSKDVAADMVITEEFTPSTNTASANIEPKFSITRWTFGLTGATLVLATLFFMGIDLVRFVPESLHAQTVAATAQRSPGNSFTQAGSLTTNNSGSSSNTSQTNPYVSAPVQTYQPPVTSIS